MSYQALLLRFDGKPMHAHWHSLRPLTLSWTALGGCDEALLALEGPSVDIGWWQGYLGYPVEVYDDSGRLHWWGWLEAVQERWSGFTLDIDLARMANRLALVYRSQEPGDGFGDWRQTPWANDAESQALYGIKERIVQMGSLADEQAIHWRDSLLSHSRLPELQSRPQTNGGAKCLCLTCKGWIHRLDWRVWQRESGVMGNSVGQSGVQALGDSVERTHIAQSFKLHRNARLNALSLRLRKQGVPGDQLRVEIRADQGGAPASSALATCFISPADLAEQHHTWVTAKFVAQINLNAGVQYWFVISRTGTISSANHYWMGLDESLSYADGQLRLFRASDQSWQPRVPLADALFKLSSLSRVDDEILSILALGSDFLTGFELESPSGLQLPAQAVSGEPALQALRCILALGTVHHKRYLMDLGQNRFLRLFLEPNEDDIPYSMSGSGLIFDRMGRVLHEKSLLAGKRVGTSHDTSFLVSGLSLDVSSGRCFLKTS